MRLSKSGINDIIVQHIKSCAFPQTQRAWRLGLLNTATNEVVQIGSYPSSLLSDISVDSNVYHFFSVDFTPYNFTDGVYKMKVIEVRTTDGKESLYTTLVVVISESDYSVLDPQPPTNNKFKIYKR